MNRVASALLVAAAACFEYRIVAAPERARDDMQRAADVLRLYGQNEWRVVTAAYDGSGYSSGWWRIVFERPIPCPTATPTPRAAKQ